MKDIGVSRFQQAGRHHHGFASAGYQEVHRWLSAQHTYPRGSTL